MEQVHAEARVRAARDVVDQLLARELHVLLGGHGPATGSAHRAHLEVELGDGSSIRQEIDVTLGRPNRSSDDTTVWPLSWTPVGHHVILPDLDGRLEVRSARWDTQLLLVGEYRPPLGPLGAIGDRVVHEHTSLAVAGFVADLARALDAHSGDVARSAHHRVAPAGRLDVPGRGSGDG